MELLAGDTGPAFQVGSGDQTHHTTECISYTSVALTNYSRKTTQGRKS